MAVLLYQWSLLCVEDMYLPHPTYLISASPPPHLPYLCLTPTPPTLSLPHPHPTYRISASPPPHLPYLRLTPPHLPYLRLTPTPPTLSPPHPTPPTLSPPHPHPTYLISASPPPHLPYLRLTPTPPNTPHFHSRSILEPSWKLFSNCSCPLFCHGTSPSPPPFAATDHTQQ